MEFRIQHILLLLAIALVASGSFTKSAPTVPEETTENNVDRVNQITDRIKNNIKNSLSVYLSDEVTDEDLVQIISKLEEIQQSANPEANNIANPDENNEHATGGLAPVVTSVTSNEEYRRVLEKLEQEAKESIDHPANFVRDEAEFEEILKMLEEDGGAEKRLDKWNQMLPQNVDDYECPICYEEMTPANEVKVWPCGHTFHSDCIRKWAEVTNHNNCPMCRQQYTMNPTGG